MHTIKIAPNLLFEYQCTSGKFYQIAESNRIEKIYSVARIESNRIETFFARIGMFYCEGEFNDLKSQVGSQHFVLKALYEFRTK